ncbi:MAG: thioredoxin domain-containing protein [Bauldia sp.]|nr:thioredoxin domain-containing protein [Bauldia sp.]
MSENLLRHEASPYLLQHNDNPVHWRPWGTAALAEARREGKPILLSVGYAACHWCHVMAHESFEDEATAAVMNRLFVNIKVDREERPDIDQIYMAALHSLGEQGGWPLTMFLSPDGEPAWGGTYFPKTARHGRPGFVDILNEVARLFREEPDKIAINRRFIMERLAEKPSGEAVSFDARLLDRAAERLLEFMDPVHGGTNGAPKFPQASLLELLWRAGHQTGDARYRDIVLLTLRSIAQGGITDHIGGGVSRYSTDARWLAPHFEKMLYDNAQLVELLTYAWLATGDPLFRERIVETADWLDREMRLPGGAFAASLDADSEGHEGSFYVWTRGEAINVLGAEEGAFFAEVYDIGESGNWEGVSIPNRLVRPERLSDVEEARLAAARAKLLERRAGRVRPATDDKILADWNGLMIAALAFAGASLDRPEWIALAADTFGFIATTMSRDGRLAHSWREGKSVFPGLATDYAAMVKAALALHAATFDAAYLAQAEALAAAVRAHHFDDASPGYFLSADDAEALIVRPKSTTDEATPSATSLMAQNLVRLWRLTGKDAYRRDVDDIIAATGSSVASNLFASTGLLNALDLRLGAVDVVIVTPVGVSPDALLAVVRARWTPNTILSVHADAVHLPDGHPAAGKTAAAGMATAYVCRGETCSLPVVDEEGLANTLGLSTRETT